QRMTVTGAALPAHIQALKIPPAWTDVTFSADPKAALLATGKDSKGRRQAVYSAEFSAGQAAAKFSRISELDQKFSEIFEQKEAAGDGGQLFPVNEKALLDHVHTFGGGGFKTKDFRTLLGTRTAMDEVAKREAPKTEKDYKKAVMEVAKVVSSKLGNTPTIAL